MSTITDNPVALSQSWGAVFNDYSIDTQKVDFQDLMVAVSEKRATAVEGEVNPLTTRIQMRNKNLDRLGAALADLDEDKIRDFIYAARRKRNFPLAVETPPIKLLTHLDRR